MLFFFAVLRIDRIWSNCILIVFFSPSFSRMDPFSEGDPIAYAEFMKAQGNRDFKNGNYSIAIKKYDEAIRVMVYLGQMRG